MGITAGFCTLKAHLFLRTFPSRVLVLTRFKEGEILWRKTQTTVTDVKRFFVQREDKQIAPPSLK